MGNRDQGISEFSHSRQSQQQHIRFHNELKEDDQTTKQVEIDGLEKEYSRDDIRRLAMARKLILDPSLRYHQSLTHGIRGNGNIFVAVKVLWACLKPLIRPQFIPF